VTLSAGYRTNLPWAARPVATKAHNCPRAYCHATSLPVTGSMQLAEDSCGMENKEEDKEEVGSQEKSGSRTS